MRSLFILFILILTANCRQKDSIYDLRQNANFDSIKMAEEYLHIKTYPRIEYNVNEKFLQLKEYPKFELNYVNTLLYTWKLLKTDSDRFSSNDNGIVLQSLSFIGDIQSINRFSNKMLSPYPQLKDTTYIKTLKKRKLNYHPARSFVLENAKQKEIIMFNEGHDRPQTRAFVVSLLEDLKKLGYVCLALETFNVHGNLKELDGTTGHYTAEPMAGEVVREALRLGFKLIPYEYVEDVSKTNELHNPMLKPKRNEMDEREFGQATNIYDRIKTKHGIERTVVLAGYAHISEASNTSLTTMAMYFKNITGINPFTIEQTILYESNQHSPYANRLLGLLLNKDSIIAFDKNDTKLFNFDTMAYDIYVYHPQTTYYHNRPTWLISTNEKHFVSIEIPKSIKPVLVQAYIKDEIKSDDDYKIKVPCDQTFYSENNKAWLALRKERQYIIIYRDNKNRIVFKKNLKT